MHTQIRISSKKLSVTIENDLLDRVSYLISDGKLDYLNNKINTNASIRNFFIKNNIKDSKELHKKLINFFLNKKLKEQICQKNLDDEFDIINYNLKDLENLCKKYDYNLILDDNEISVYPIKDDFIGASKPYIKHIIDSFAMNNPKEALKLAVDYVYKEIIFIKEI